MLAGWEPQLEHRQRSGDGRSQEEFRSFLAQCMPGESSAFCRISLCYCPSSFNVGQDSLRRKMTMRVPLGFQLDGFGKHQICFHGPHISAALSHLPSTSLCWTAVLLVPVAFAGAIKLSLIIPSAAKQLTAHFTKLPQVHCWKLCVCLSRSWLPSSVHCSFAELWVKL